MEGAPYGDVIISLAQAADGVTPWGTSPSLRDRQLREFWPTESILASALYSTVAKYTAFGWTLRGPRDLTLAVQQLFHGFEHGEGWVSLMTKVLIDLFTQDNGAFIEIVRTEDDASAPVVCLNHLDSGRCIRTGVHATPVRYFDYYGKPHLLKWYQIIPLAEMPSPIEQMRGMQYCAVTRLLRAAQILRDITIYKAEKVSGRFTGAVHLVSGVQGPTLEAAIQRNRSIGDAEGLTRYVTPVIVASLDPTAQVSTATLPLASLPDGFNEESAMKWYINQLALSFGADYQDYAPLPGGGLGSSEQSETLHKKSRGKGSRLFMSMIEQVFNFHGVLPQLVEFRFGDQDITEDTEQATLRKIRAEERAVRIGSGELTPEQARQIAVDVGDLDEAYLVMNNETNLTDEITVSGNAR